MVGECADGTQAVASARRFSPDVVLMDIRMPELDGLEATVQIRAEREGDCVLMLTGSNSSQDIDRARRAGAAAYVTKDRIAVELVEAIVELASR